MSPTPTPDKPPKLSDFGLTEDVVSSSRKIVERSKMREGCGLWSILMLPTFLFCLCSGLEIGLSLIIAAFVGFPLMFITMLICYPLWEKVCKNPRKKKPDYDQAAENVSQHAQFRKAQKAYEEAQRRKKADY